MTPSLLDSYVDKDILLKFKGDIAPSPMGPGRLSRLDDWHQRAEPDGTVSAQHGYQLLTPSVIGDPNGQRANVLLPIVFEAEDVLWISTGPIHPNGESAIVTPGGKRSASGIITGS